MKGNPSLLSVSGADANKSDTWQYRHRVKHTAYSTTSATNLKSIRAAEYASGAGIAVKMIEDAEGQEWEIIHTTAVIDLAKVAANTNSPQTVAVTFFYDGIPNSEFDDHDFKGALPTDTKIDTLPSVMYIAATIIILLFILDQKMLWKPSEMKPLVVSKISLASDYMSGMSLRVRLVHHLEAMNLILAICQMLS